MSTLIQKQLLASQQARFALATALVPPFSLSMSAFTALSAEIRKTVLSVLDYITAPLSERAVTQRSKEIERIMLSVALRASECHTASEYADAFRITYAQCSQLNKYDHREVACTIEYVCAAMLSLDVARKERAQDNKRALVFNVNSSLFKLLLARAAVVLDDVAHSDADYLSDIVVQTALVFMRDTTDTLQ